MHLRRLMWGPAWAAAVGCAAISVRAQNVPNYLGAGPGVSCTVLKAAPGSFDYIGVTSNAPGTVFLIDSATCPGNGSFTAASNPPLVWAPALNRTSTGQYQWSWSEPPNLWFANGVTVAVSSSAAPRLNLEPTALIVGVPR